MRDAGAATIAQGEATSVVIGMPLRAINYGAAERNLPLTQFAGAVSDWRDHASWTTTYEGKPANR